MYALKQPRIKINLEYDTDLRKTAMNLSKGGSKSCAKEIWKPKDN